MSAALLFTFGSIALILTSNALRRLRRPRALFPPLWLPAMITTELAPLWLLVTTLTAVDHRIERPIFYGWPREATRTLRWVGAQALHEAEHHLDDVRRQR